MDSQLLLVTSCVVFLSTAFQAVAGFGYAIIAAPLLASVLGVKETVVFLLIGSIYMRIYMLYKVRRDMSFSLVKRIFLGAMVGAVPGGLVLRFFTPQQLCIFLGLVLILALIALKANIRWHSKHPVWEQFGFGFLGGFFNASTSIGGPPIVLYMLNSGQPKVPMRANLTLYFFIANIWTVVAWFFIGNVHLGDLVGLPLWTLPAAFLGVYVGEKIFFHINQVTFNRLAIATILFCALNMLYKGIKM